MQRCEDLEGQLHNSEARVVQLTVQSEQLSTSLSSEISRAAASKEQMDQVSTQGLVVFVTMEALMLAVIMIVFMSFDRRLAACYSAGRLAGIETT